MIIDKNNVEDILSLGCMQSGMLYHYLIDKGGEQYFEQLELVVCGYLDFNLFEETWKIMIENNEMLRTVFRWKEVKSPLQVIFKEMPFQIKTFDFSLFKDKEKMIIELKEEDKKSKFDLEIGPLIRLYICKVEENKHSIIISNHHIIYDGWSNGILLKECFEIYDRLREGKAVLSYPKAKFKDYIKLLNDREVDKYKNFWVKYLDNIKLSNINILKESSEDKEIVKQVSSTIPITLMEELNGFSKDKKTTISTVLNVAWGILLQRYSNDNDIIFGTTVSGRAPEIINIDKTVGLFINTIPLRVKFSQNQLLDELLRNVDSDLIERSDFENTELVSIKEWCNLGNNENLFDTVLVIENYPLEKGLFKKDYSLSIETYFISETTNYDLVISIEINDVTSVTINYNANIYSNFQIERMLIHFINILRGLCKKELKYIDEISNLNNEEKKQIITDFNDSEKFYLSKKTIDYLFEEQVKNTPDAVAIIYEDKELTYNQLNNLANQLAKILQEKVKVGQFVGIMLNRSMELVISMLAVLKSGAAYIPIDSSYPKERIYYILKDSTINLLITEKTLIGNNKSNVDVLFINEVEKEYNQICNIKRIHNSEDSAYCIYTSGSAGNPKGVIIKHSSIVNTLSWRSKYYNFNSQDVVMQIPSFSFDSSIEDIFTPLISGAKLVIMNENRRKDPVYMKEILEKYSVTHFLIVPSMYRIILNEIPESLKKLRFVTVAGELCTEDIIENHFEKLENVELYNEYGPTENSVCTTVNKVKRNSKGSVIGKPINNTNCFIMSSNNLQPVGVAGELCISGVGLAKGYVNNDKLSKEKFIINSTIDGTLKSIYKTGDLARWLPNGDIEFLGRIDEQVKIRGFRIEKGEIEDLLIKYDGINGAVVSVIDDSYAKELVAYITSDLTIDIKAVKIYLSSRLPEYSIPLYIVQIHHIPITVNGKIDRNAFNKLNFKKELESNNNYVEPKNDIEKQLEKIWCKVLNFNKVSTDAKFFDIGGNSLKIISLTSLINKEFNKEFNIIDLFKYTTIQSIANIIEEQQIKKSDEEIAIYRY